MPNYICPYCGSTDTNMISQKAAMCNACDKRWDEVIVVKKVLTHVVYECSCGAHVQSQLFNVVGTQWSSRSSFTGDLVCPMCGRRWCDVKVEAPKE